VVRRAEAAVAAAFFSTSKQVQIDPVNETTPYGRASADYYSALLDQRLGKSIPWFLTVVGAYQTANVMGACFSKQYWRYEVSAIGKRPMMRFDEQTKTRVPVTTTDPTTGAQVVQTETVWGVNKDEPACDLLRPENVLFSPSADYRDPINTSPFLELIHTMPMSHVKRRMALRDTKTGMPLWREYPDAVILRSKIGVADMTAQAREGPDRYAPDQQQRNVIDHEMIEIREFFCEWDGIDWHWMQLGSTELLMEAAPTVERYKHCRAGERPVTMGLVNIEALSAFPRSKVNLTAPLQWETNDLANLRIDNLRLSLQPRAKVIAGRVQNPDALRRVDPGEPLFVRQQDDLQWDKPPSVDAAAYAEQDRLNTDFDELAGNFSASSVMTNRRLNETVGGMNILSNAATSIGEYEVKVFTMTWFAPTIDQLLRLEQRYETDTTIMALAADKAKLALKYGMSELTDELLDEELVVEPNVTLGATDPQQQIQRFAMGFMTLGQIVTPMVQAVGPQFLATDSFKNIAQEIFGKLGYRDIDRFIGDIAQLVQQAAGQPQHGKGGAGPDPQVEMMKLKGAMDREQVKGQTARDVAKIHAAGKMIGEHIKHVQDVHAASLDRQHENIQNQHDRTHDLVQAHISHAHATEQAAQGQQFDASQAAQGRAFDADQADKGRAFDAQQAQRQQMADLAGVAGERGGSRDANDRATGPAAQTGNPNNQPAPPGAPLPMSPLAAQFANENQPAAAGWGAAPGTSVAPPSPGAAPPAPQAGGIEQSLAAFMQRANAVMNRIESDLAELKGFARRHGTA
jgi:hypothetical protein